jgi:hypothetical protein
VVAIDLATRHGPDTGDEVLRPDHGFDRLLVGRIREYPIAGKELGVQCCRGTRRRAEEESGGRGALRWRFRKNLQSQLRKSSVATSVMRLELGVAGGTYRWSQRSQALRQPHLCRPITAQRIFAEAAVDLLTAPNGSDPWPCHVSSHDSSVVLTPCTNTSRRKFHCP